MSEAARRSRWPSRSSPWGQSPPVLRSLWPNRPPAPESDVVQLAPLPPYSETRYLNASPEASHIGSAACASCHPNNHKSYLLTAHSRSLADVDLATEPPDGAFDHPLRPLVPGLPQGRRLAPRGSVEDRNRASEISRIDHPVRYLVGSGHFSRTYLVEVEGFLQESPITWYAAKQKWGMSPGYDAPRHAGFERPVAKGCVVCHAGRVEATGEAAKPAGIPREGRRLRELPRAGVGPPGLPRVQQAPAGRGRPDHRSPRRACAAAARVDLRVLPSERRRDRARSGPEFGDFLPGRPLTDYRVHYRLDGDGQMTVVGHVEQLRQSAATRSRPT